MPVVYVTRYTLQGYFQFESKCSWEASLFCYIRIFLQKAYKSAFLVRFGVSLILCTLLPTLLPYSTKFSWSHMLWIDPRHLTSFSPSGVHGLSMRINSCVSDVCTFDHITISCFVGIMFQTLLKKESTYWAISQWSWTWYKFKVICCLCS